MSSCLEEEERVGGFEPRPAVNTTRPPLPPPPPPPAPSYYEPTLDSIYYAAEQSYISAEELVGLRLSLNHIYFTAEDGTYYENRMRPCYLTLEELSQDCSSFCAARLDEDLTTLPLVSHLVGHGKDQDHPRLRILIDEGREGTGSLLNFLRQSIFPVLAQADWIVSRSGNNYYLYSEAPVSFGNTVFNKRFIELIPR